MHEAMLPCREAAKNAEEDNSVTELYLQAGPDSPVERARVDLLEQVQLAFALGNSALESRAGVPTLEYMLQSFAPGDGLDSTASCARRGSLREGEARLAAWPCICRPACVPVPAQLVHRKIVWRLTSLSALIHTRPRQLDSPSTSCSIQVPDLACCVLQIASEPAYDTLRTKQQLGYSVHVGTRLTHGALGFCVTVASGDCSIGFSELFESGDSQAPQSVFVGCPKHCGHALHSRNSLHQRHRRLRCPLLPW